MFKRELTITVEVDRSTSAVLKSETSVTSGSDAGSRLASSSGGTGERAFLTTSTTTREGNASQFVF